MKLTDELQSRVLCGDGAMGTLLMERGVPADRCFEELCLSDADRIFQIHADYIAAGARLVTTNTFGASAVRLGRYGFEGKAGEINRQAARLARRAARGTDAWVAGSVGPLGISGGEAAERDIDRAAVFREQIEALLDGGVDLIFFETFQSVNDLGLALEIQRTLGDCPAICSLASNENGLLPDGTNVQAAFATLRQRGAGILGLNCINGPQAMLRLLKTVSAGETPLAVFPNAGRPRYYEGRYVYETTPEYFAEAAVAAAESGARIFGGCCGTTPAHIAAAARALAGFKPVRARIITVTPPAVTSPADAPSEPNLLDRIAEGKTVIVTELDPPKTLQLDRYFLAADELTKAGSDAITLADNSLAILRVSNLAIGAMLKQRNVMPLLHISCRDRNLLGLQSDLMGMAAMGIRHVLPLTGDPAKVGDHPGAASVYDVNSIKLIEIISRLNDGFTQSGAALKKTPGFVIGCTFNPNAKNLEAQVSRLSRKVAAGAQYVMTQPVFDPALVAETARVTAQFNVPVFVGIWPLLNGRQAKFLHNEVPGITIPTPVLARMGDAEGPEGRRIGLEIAKEVTRAVLDHFPCIYLITPFLAYETTAELASFVRSR